MYRYRAISDTNRGEVVITDADSTPLLVLSLLDAEYLSESIDLAARVGRRAGTGTGQVTGATVKVYRGCEWVDAESVLTPDPPTDEPLLSVPTGHLRALSMYMVDPGRYLIMAEAWDQTGGLSEDRVLFEGDVTGAVFALAAAVEASEMADVAMEAAMNRSMPDDDGPPEHKHTDIHHDHDHHDHEHDPATDSVVPKTPDPTMPEVCCWAGEGCCR